MTRRVQFAQNEFYHLYNRGTEKRKIFFIKSDYERFLTLLYLCNNTEPADLKFQGTTLEETKSIERAETLVDIGVYCLMPNHFHLLVREKTEKGISTFMQKLLTGYTMYFNRKRNRTGVLFQGKFKATHADDDAYLSYLIAYIHLNPVKLLEPNWKEDGISDQTGAEKFLEKYQYSSYLDYLGVDRLEKIVLEKDSLPEYNESPASFQKSVSEWLSYKQGPTS